MSGNELLSADPMVKRLRNIACQCEQGDFAPTYGQIIRAAADQLEQTKAQLQVATAALSKAISTAQWQASTNRELNQLAEKLGRYVEAMDKIYNHNEAARAAVVQHFGVRHE